MQIGNFQLLGFVLWAHFRGSGIYLFVNVTMQSQHFSKWLEIQHQLQLQ